MTEHKKPFVAVTMGDPAGIGPEVIARAWGDERMHAAVQPFVIGHPEIMRRAVALLRVDIRIAEIEAGEELGLVSPDRRVMPCLRVADDDVLSAPVGCVDARAGEAAYQAVRRAAELALAGRVDAIVTAPLSKVALHAAGHFYPGHTELLAQMCGVSEFAMMLWLSGPLRIAAPRGYPRLRNEDDPLQSEIRNPKSEIDSGLGVVHVTLHQSLRSVFVDLTSDAILAKCRLIDGVMRRLGVLRPRIAVCALNPHAGEDGLFGDEERTIIRPAVELAGREGLDVAGPFPTDTLMARAAAGEFDAVVAMYHDQGHIAVKLLNLHSAVNITLGLPIVRTSVAHGTAFDRAWQGTARADGMIATIQAAATLARNR
jgi:4-hydroxy-L-threonine phosphate dehydrogenase PdxA